MKKYVMFVLIGVLMLIPMIVNAAFPDVETGHWAAGYIEELTSKGVINGYNDGTFKPNNTLTKGEYLKLIITASFPDSDFSLVDKGFDHWAASYVKVAEHYGIIEEGEINIENIDTPITRMDVVKILGLCDINIRMNDQKSVLLLSFVDTDELSITETILLKHAVAKGIIGGYPDGTFKPNNNLTRAEVTKILSVYMSK